MLKKKILQVSFRIFQIFILFTFEQHFTKIFPISNLKIFSLPKFLQNVSFFPFSFQKLPREFFKISLKLRHTFPTISQKDLTSRETITIRIMNELTSCHYFPTSGGQSG